MTKKRVQKQSFKWSFFLILLIAVLALGVLIIYLSIERPFCANSDSCTESFSLNIENDSLAVFNGQTITPPKVDLAKTETTKKVLGEAVLTGEKHIYVDLSTQTLTAYQGDTLFMEAKVSTGKWNKTPTGDFTIWEKLRSTKMSGGQGADYYYLPNVPFVMFFEGPKASAGQGFSLHGAYWHNNFGHPMSHGCVNMRSVDAEKLYYWVGPEASGSVTRSTSDNPGTKITIYGESP
jgi:hypothetical protein